MPGATSSSQKGVSVYLGMRIAFIGELLSDSGFEEREIQSRARLFVIYFSWSEVMYPPNPDGLEGEDLDQILDVICGA